MEKKIKVENESLDWVIELSAGIIKKTIEDYCRYSKRIINGYKRLKKIRNIGTDLHEQKMTIKRIKRNKQELKDVIKFFNSEWCYFLTSISWNKMKDAIKNVYLNTWKLKKNSIGYLYLCSFIRKEK